MATLVFTHPACLEHDPGPGHPERPERLRVILDALRGPGFEDLVWREARRATDAELERAHDRAYIAAVMHAVPQTGRVALDLDTAVSPGSGEAALRAAGAVCGAVDALLAGEGTNAFCAVRPPGHHALRDEAMGFCLFNNVAIGAFHARAVHGLGRIAVVDFDVHHGNGTQAMFERDADLFYASTHQWPAYPGTGGADERGVANNVVNVPLAPTSGSDEFREAWRETILPALAGFRPELILVSAGFDAHVEDPLASLRLVEADYEWVTREIGAVAAAYCKGRVVSALEGGYSLHALEVSVPAHVRALMAA